MLKFLLASSAVATALVLSQPAKAVVINLGVNPTSAQGDFSTSPGGGAFTDQVTFQLVGGPQFITLANATNVFAQASDQITNWTASFYQQIGAIGGGDDVLLFGPQAASPCAVIPSCQQVGGSALLNPGSYYVQFAGIGGGTSGYGGNVSTFAVPGPLAGAGLPGLVMALAGFIGWRRHRRTALV